MNVLIITDCKDVAYLEMKHIIKSAAKDKQINFDLVEVSEFSLINAAFLIRLISEVVVGDTILSVVINPTQNRFPRIYGELKNGVKFFGANTGALTWTIEDIGYNTLYEINDPGFVTFGGKNVHAPNIANLVNDIEFKDLGVEFKRDELTKLTIKDGTVVHIDNFGLIKIKGKPLEMEDEQTVQVFKNGEPLLTAKYSDRMMSEGDKEWILYNGSSLGFPELGTVRYKYGYKDVGVNIGDIITWKIL